MNKDNLKVLLLILVIIVIVITVYLTNLESKRSNAMKLYNEGKYIKAQEEILNVFDRLPSFLQKRSEELLALAEINYNLSKFKESEKYYIQVLSYEKNHGLASYRLGVMREKDANYKESVKYFKNAYDNSGDDEELMHLIRPRLAEVSYRYGMQLYYAGRFEDAKVYLQTSVEVYEYFPEAISALGQLKRKQKDYKNAWSYMEKAISLNPKLTIVYKDVKAVLTRIRSYNKAALMDKQYQEIKKELIPTYEEQTLVEE